MRNIVNKDGNFTSKLFGHNDKKYAKFFVNLISEKLI